MRLLVTGTAGFIGRSVTRAALERGHEVTALVRDAAKAQAVLPAHPNLQLSVCERLEDFVPDPRGYDRLVHLAWPGALKYTDPALVTEHLAPQFSFLSRLADSGVKDMTVAGTCLEYGMKEGALAEDMVAVPSTYYGIAKRTLHDMLKIRDAGLNVKWLRYFYVYGADQRPQSLFPQVMAAVKRGDSVFKMSPGDQGRDFVHVDTVAHNTVVIAENPALSGIFNIGNGRNVRVADFVRDIMRQQGREMQLELGFYPYPAYEPFSFFADAARLKAVPGARLDDGIIVREEGMPHAAPRLSAA